MKNWPSVFRSQAPNFKCWYKIQKPGRGKRAFIGEKIGQLWLPSFQHDMLRLSDSSFHPFFHRPTWQLLPGHCSVSRWRMSTPADGANCFNLLQWTARSEWPIWKISLALSTQQAWAKARVSHFPTATPIYLVTNQPSRYQRRYPISCFPWRGFVPTGAALGTPPFWNANI